MLSLYDIPSEILVSILSSFPTQALLPLVLVDHKFHSTILRILHFRLLLAAALPEYKIILEAYHPSRRNTEPYLFCAYLGTDGLSSKHEGEGSLYEDCDGIAGRLGKLGQLYSRFRPENPGVQGLMPLRRIAGATPVQASGSNTQPIYKNDGDGGTKKITHALNIDSNELFTQFCAYASLVRLGPRRGIFLSTVHIVESGEGVMRVWREWLQDRAAETKNLEDEGSEDTLQRTPTDIKPLIADYKSIIWTNYKRNTGLRVVVRDTQRRSTSTQDDADDLPLTFSVEIKGRTSLERWRLCALHVSRFALRLLISNATSHIRSCLQFSPCLTPPYSSDLH
jgi:hypothetical protein